MNGAPALDPKGPVAFESLFVRGELDFLKASLGPSSSADDPHLIVYTSGTTAKPKGCVHTWNTLGYTVCVKSAGLAWPSDDATFSPSPISHSTCYVNGVMIPLSAGGGTHLMEQWEPFEGLHRMAEFNCTTTTTATVFLKMALDAFDPAVQNIDTMRSWVAAGSPIPVAAQRFRRRYCLPGARSHAWSLGPTGAHRRALYCRWILTIGRLGCYGH